MPTHFFPLTVLTQHLEDETFISEVLNFDEISRFHTNEEAARHSARVNAEIVLKNAYPPQLYSRIAPPGAGIREITLEIEPPKKTSVWRTPVSLKIHYVRIDREDGYFSAYVPALHITVLSRREKDFEAKIEAEIRSALRRDGWLKSLQYLRWLERIERLSLERSELAVYLPTAKQRAIAEENDVEEEKSVFQ
jgi:hypothetical protein